MPITAIVEWVRNRWSARAVLQNGQTAVDSGKWANLEGLFPAVVTVSGTATGLQLNLLYANTEQPPADSDNNWPTWGTQITTAVAGVIIDAPVRYVKAQVAAITGGAVTVAVQAAART